MVLLLAAACSPREVIEPIEPIEPIQRIQAIAEVELEALPEAEAQAIEAVSVAQEAEAQAIEALSVAPEAEAQAIEAVSVAPEAESAASLSVAPASEAKPREGSSVAPASGAQASEASSALEARRVEGLSIVTRRSGGRAQRLALGGLELAREGRFGGKRIYSARGVGGLGLGGYGTGGGGLGVGSGRGGVRAGFGAEGEGGQNVAGFTERSPFAYAELSLPYRGGKTAIFEPRVDARINEVIDARADMLSTFAIDVDTAAYAIARRTIAAGHAPEPTSVRVEEFVNYFRYDYAPPSADPELFTIEAGGVRSPMNEDEHILRIGLQARVVRDADRLPAGLVFLIDTSCSMTGDDKLALAKESVAIAVDHLKAGDQVAISTYAGGVQLVLPPTPVEEKARILSALASLSPGGGTAMASGLELAYRQAEKMLAPGRITRVIVCSDGDANIGASAPDEMLKRIASAVSEGVTLSTIGFGDGNYKDATMEQIANRGNGNYFYVDDRAQARRVFGRDLTKMLQDVAQDVKIQVAFDPRAVAKYRLIGYENRDLADEDFRNDRVDAGEIGAGHQVTALYAVELQRGAVSSRARLGTVFVRAKRPRGLAAKEAALEVPVSLIDRPYEAAEADLQFAIAVMGAAEILRHSPHAARWTLDQMASLARATFDGDAEEELDRREFVGLIERAARL